ncbi:multidrug efflux SMR transporter [Streptomyces sp. NBC_00053]|uniref:DMT family transporter n=1 Tax=unclassified Streptomyces TaxID=2593676 RepID=UPI000F5C1D8F|nr:MULTISPECIES: multidrug efflux SMR transporter [unclassified Streptomyces]WSX05818.1 multidrug efflux SMR transporter [Streptomyces sp. NBC_00987]MCX5104047.1 multidrug efflux SMR transporter [Streptomyces sp. NBC_00439]MCX5164903.1 multidrug efflux SMR transporter [Streptomyces sp. NBC_00305]MCX5223427.1 multidrug efflux SMR transporter [Streptomyces sp. NBC_00264]MCX5505028.1 multidrug efflux SMR transporter [Streptomyces sp. NBC_00052]
MSWLLLIGAGLVEIAWSQSIEPTRGFTRPLPTLVCAVLMIGAVYLLARAMEGLPVGTAYAVFTGIGAIGVIALGVLVHHDPVSPGRLAAVALIVGGVVLARMTTPAA